MFSRGKRNASLTNRKRWANKLVDLHTQADSLNPLLERT